MNESTEHTPKSKRPQRPNDKEAVPAAKSKSRGAKSAPAGPITLRWELSELPSSQHKAGLAGLAICVEHWQRGTARKGVCRVKELDSGGLTLEVDRDGMQSLFDDIYAASMEEQLRDKPLQKKTASGAKVEIPPKRTVEQSVADKKGVEKLKTFYVYDQAIPHGGVIGEWDQSPRGSQAIWLKLWRDLVWTALRGVPATREPYDARAEGRAISDGAEVWDELATEPDASVDLPSTYYLGAQAKSAENVSFLDAARSRFLLHFWPFAVPIYVPAEVDREGKREFAGYALVVPDIDDLESFVADWPALARERPCEASGYRPRAAIVDLPVEAALDLAYRTFAIIAKREGAKLTSDSQIAADVFHIEKEGNNVRIRGVRRVDLRADRADAYARRREVYWSPLFRRQRILNIIEDDRSWWSGFGRLCATTPREQTIEDSKFRHDCRIAFTEVEMSETTGQNEKTLEHLIYQATRAYVFGRLKSKYGLSWDEVTKNPSKKDDYEDKKEKVAREAFLAVRSRTGADFVGYFTSVICSVPQRLGERGFLEVARALHDERQVERVRSLTLLALSASA